jgi:hypothetical protein
MKKTLPWSMCLSLSPFRKDQLKEGAIIFSLTRKGPTARMVSGSKETLTQ